MSKSWKIVLVLGAIFAAGGATGGLVALRVAREARLHGHPFKRDSLQERRRPVDAWGERQLRQCTAKLDLSEEQQAKIKALLQAAQEEIRGVRAESVAKITESTDRLNTQIADLLTDEQRVKFEELLEERQKQLKKWQAERALWDGHPPERGPRPPPR